MLVYMYVLEDYPKQFVHSFINLVIP